MPSVFGHAGIFFQLVSHKILRLLVPYMFIVSLLTSIALARVSVAFAIVAAVQLVVWSVAAVGLRHEVTWLCRYTRPAAALLMLNAAAIMGLHRFLFTKGSLWKIWIPAQTPQTTKIKAAKQTTNAVEPDAEHMTQAR
jgi:hypothetical protein